MARQGATTDHSLSYGRKEQRSMGEKEPKELVKNFVPGALAYINRSRKSRLRELDTCSSLPVERMTEPPLPLM